MKAKLLVPLLLTVLVVLAAGAAFYWKDFLLSKFKKEPQMAMTAPSAALMPPVVSEQQQELDQLTAQLITDMRAENRLNLSMTAQLRGYQEMLKQVTDYGQKIENDMDMIRQISKDDFQEDVVLQAALFTGKKPEIVASHLEEFPGLNVKDLRVSRAGAFARLVRECLHAQLISRRSAQSMLALSDEGRVDDVLGALP